MRWYILRALLHKEAARHLGNRAGIALALMLVVASLLLSIFDPDKGGGSTGLIGGIHHCYVDLPASEQAWTAHLRENIPKQMKGQIIFRAMPPVMVGTGSIRVEKEVGDPPRLTVITRYPEGQPLSLESYEKWFWRETRRFMQNEIAITRPELSSRLPPMPDFSNDQWVLREAIENFRSQIERIQGKPLPEFVIERNEVHTSSVLDLKVAIAMGLVVFSLFFTCIYLLPAFTCEERERGILLAQALSPASPIEILVAKFLFYPVTGMVLASILTAIYKVSVLGTLFYWLSLLAVSLGFLGIGMVVACLAKTQRAASMGALTYAMSLALIMMICQQNNIPVIPQLALEYHGPKILHAALQEQVYRFHWAHLMGAMCLAIGWCAAAAILFRRRGWQ